jgi:subtilase family serine protease
MLIMGTSLGSPQWAGYMALVGEARETAGKSRLGYLNPIIYGYSASDLAQLFHDITTGSSGNVSAQPGWDMLTGWGSMNASILLNRLVQE